MGFKLYENELWTQGAVFSRDQSYKRRISVWDPNLNIDIAIKKIPNKIELIGGPRLGR